MANGDNQVTIDFVGICAHFLKIVDGVPHRVVLPKTTEVANDTLQVGIDPLDMPYSLQPHFGFVFHQVSGGPAVVEAPPGLMEGFVSTSVSLQILNATDTALVYDKSFDTVPLLSYYMPDFLPSNEVVAGGKAQCYFDIFGGTVTAETERGGAVHTLVTIKTDGPPRLQIKPIDASTDPGQPWLHDIPIGPTLVVANFSESCKDARFDFMWHYLTNDTGIPPHLAKDPPGLLDSSHAGRRSISTPCRSG